MKFFIFSVFIFFQSQCCASPSLNKRLNLTMFENKSTYYYQSFASQVSSPTSFGIDLSVGSRTQINQYLKWGNSLSLGLKGGNFASNIIAPFFQLNGEVFCNFGPNTYNYFGIKLGGGIIYDDSHCAAPIPIPLGIIHQETIILFGRELCLKNIDSDDKQDRSYSRRAKLARYNGPRRGFYQIGITHTGIEESSSRIALFVEYGW